MNNMYSNPVEDQIIDYDFIDQCYDAGIEDPCEYYNDLITNRDNGNYLNDEFDQAMNSVKSIFDGNWPNFQYTLS